MKADVLGHQSRENTEPQNRGEQRALETRWVRSYVPVLALTVCTAGGRNQLPKPQIPHLHKGGGSTYYRGLHKVTGVWARSHCSMGFMAVTGTSTLARSSQRALPLL